MKKLLEISDEAQNDQLRVESDPINLYNITYDFQDQTLKYETNGTKSYSNYILNRPLINAVNAAIISGRPLLIKGEPGSGKTKLAEAIAVFFHEEEARKFYFEWFVKSTSTARDGAYLFDQVSRLRDATISGNDTQAKKRVTNLENYVTLGPMGMAFKAEPPEGRPVILLIDEIDKGDIDFPNDLLLELDEMRFQIRELGDHYVSAKEDARPLVIITSNDERELPPAFLRRCLYYSIPPFDKALLEDIARAKLIDFYKEIGTPNTIELNDTNISEIVDKFQALKEYDAGDRPPSTSEFLDWLKMICYKLHKEDISLEEVIHEKELQQLVLKTL